MSDSSLSVFFLLFYDCVPILDTALGKTSSKRKGVYNDLFAELI